MQVIIYFDFTSVSFCPHAKLEDKRMCINIHTLTHSTRILFKSMLLILDKLHLNIQASSEWFINTTRHYFYLRCLRKYKKCCFLRVYIIYVLDVDDLSWRLLNAFKSLLFLSRYEINSFQRNLRKGNMIYIHICWGYVHTPN